MSDNKKYKLLTDEEVLKIREYYKTYKPSLSKLAKMFDTSKSNIYKIVNNLSWNE